MKYQNLRDRTFRFAVDTVAFCRALPATWEARRIAGQLFDAGTAVGANYRASQRSRSDKEFVSKIGVVIEESDESAFWLELLEASRISSGTELTSLLSEACQLRAIFVTSRATAQKKIEAKTAKKNGKRERTAETPNFPSS